MSWQQGKLGDFVEFKYGKELPERTRSPGAIRVYGSGGVIGSHNKALVQGPGIVVGRKGTVGSVFWEHDDFFPIDTTFYVFSKTDVQFRFAYYLLKSLPLQEMNTDAAVPGLNRDNALRFGVKIPTSEIQTNIIELLSKYDDLIENNKRRIELLEKSARQLYKEWFVRFRFPGHEHVKIIDGVPEGWETANLGSVIKISKGKNITKSTITPGEVPVVAGGLRPAYYHNKANTISPTITVSASGANAGYVNLYHEDIWASDCSFIDNKNDQSVYFYFLLLKERQLEIFTMQKGAAQPHVYPKDLMRLEVNIPPKPMLEQFFDLVSPNFKHMKVLGLQNRQLEKARDILLPKLMNGEVTV